jgi:GGDEF domain-containing protein
MAQRHWPITFSIGALVCEHPPSSIEGLLQAADQLMYDVKQTGKNAIAYSEIGFRAP